MSSFFALYFTLFKREYTPPSTHLAHASLRTPDQLGDCNKLQFFWVGSGIQNQACIEEPLTTRPPFPTTPTTKTFFYFPPPILSPPFGPAREFRKEAWVLFSLPLHPSPQPGFLKPIHALSGRSQSPISALWGLSLCCCAAAAAPPEAARAYSSLEGLSSHDWV